MENNDYLAHYGVKGMRWGVRRYRNEDGSLNARGKKKLTKLTAKYAKQEKRVNRARARLESRVSYGRTNTRNLKRLRKAALKYKHVEKIQRSLAKKINKISGVNAIPKSTLELGMSVLNEVMK